MIIGIGTDIVHVPRLERSARRFEDRFLKRLFTPAELNYCQSRATPYPSLAARFAAKEAFFKASQLEYLPWLEIEVARQTDGRPLLHLSGRAREAHGMHRVHLSLSHDGEYAVAYVIIEE